jgi:hypothetical protein
MAGNSLATWVVAACVLVAIACGRRHDLNYDNRFAHLAQQRDSLEQLARDLRAYRRIRSMSSGERRFEVLNGTLIADDSSEVSTDPGPNLAPIYPLMAVLARDSVSPTAHATFRQRLARTGYIEVELADTYTAFMHDGFVDNANGYLWVEPGAETPEIGGALLGGRLVGIDPVEERWFYVAID